MAQLSFQPFNPPRIFNTLRTQGNGYIYGAYGTGQRAAITRTKDGINWTDTGGYTPSEYAGLSRVQGNILYSTDGRYEYTLLVSEDLGVSWYRQPFPIENRDYSWFLLTSSNCVFVWYTQKNTLHVSKNKGASWQNTGLTSILEVIPTQRGTYVLARDRRTVYFSADGISWQRLPSPPISGDLYFGINSTEPAFFLPNQRSTVLWLNEVSEWVPLALPEPMNSKGAGYGLGLYALDPGLFLMSSYGSKDDPNNPMFCYFQDSGQVGEVCITDYFAGGPIAAINNGVLFMDRFMTVISKVVRAPFWQNLVLTNELVGQ